jgi:hypothetical protein
MFYWVFADRDSDQLDCRSAGSGANVGVKPSWRQKRSRRATVSGLVLVVVRRRIWAAGLPARLEASAAMAMHFSGR